MKKENCIFKQIYLFNQIICDSIFIELIENLYKNVIFSTFPYQLYNQENSIVSLHNFSSGNCITFCYFIKKYLQQNYNIKSYIIGASVPSIFKLKGTPNMCHCSILIPKSTYEFYILDGALYFLQPMYCNLKENTKRYIFSSNASKHQKRKINYHIKSCNKKIIDSHFQQIIPNKSLSVSCYYEDIPLDTWDYYLCEIENPDYNIGYSYLKHKKYPFLLFTFYEDGIVKLKYKIEIKNNNLEITTYPDQQIVYNDQIEKLSKFNKDIPRELHKYFIY